MSTKHSEWIEQFCEDTIFRIYVWKAATKEAFTCCLVAGNNLDSTTLTTAVMSSSMTEDFSLQSPVCLHTRWNNTQFIFSHCPGEPRWWFCDFISFCRLKTSTQRWRTEAVASYCTKDWYTSLTRKQNSEHKCVFHVDNVLQHTTRLVTKWLQGNKIQQLYQRLATFLKTLALDVKINLYHLANKKILIILSYLFISYLDKFLIMIKI